MVARDRARRLQAQGRDIIDLTAGEPDFDTPKHISAAVMCALAAGETRYTPVNGTPALRRAIVDKLARENGVRYELDQITVGSGAKQVNLQRPRRHDRRGGRGHRSCTALGLLSRRGACVRRHARHRALQ
jgi:aspartate/methionine/tyrosine aminotransferase